MPTYEYICDKCEQHFDLSQSIKDAALTVCPKEKCGRKKWGKGRVKRAIGSGAGLIFKGTGFYITDYRSENYKAGAKKDSGGGDGGAAPKTETKPASPAKTEAKPAKAKDK